MESPRDNEVLHQADDIRENIADGGTKDSENDDHDDSHKDKDKRIFY
jgi:hypothetical protein